ncbi:MAG: hypothetical protein OXK73_17620 [Rhodospirillaceae bacterium]|nr:hypothetical protein [Rhodospirillaceae bacterium]
MPPCRTHSVRHAAIAVTLAATLAHAPVVLAQDNHGVALEHARTIALAWQHLEDHVLERSTAATSWPGATPPASTGWRADWTTRGIGALYCDSVLAVFANRDDLKGVGDDQRQVRLAPHLEAALVNRDEPPLHWFSAGTAEGILGRDSVTLPACMAATAPSDRVGLAGEVVDPFTVTDQRVTTERQDRTCPARTHGAGQVWARDITQEVNGRGDDQGSPVTGAWSLLVDHCVADYDEWVHFRTTCTFTPGAPHPGTLTGETVWRRQRSVTTAGETWLTAPEFVSTSCWTDPNPTPPVPRDWTTTSTSSRTVSCPSPQIGQRTQRRSTSRFYRQWPWDAAATLVRTTTSSWTQTASTCRQPPPPPPPQCPAGQTGTPPNCETPPPEQCPAGQTGTPPNCSTPETEETTSSPQDTPADTPVGGGGGGDRGQSWDTDGDGRGDYANYKDIPDGEKDQAEVVDGDVAPGQDTGSDDGNNNGDRGGGGGPDGDRGAGGGPGGAPGSGDRGR